MLGLEPKASVKARRATAVLPEIELSTDRPDVIEADGIERRLVTLPRPQRGLAESEAAKMLADRVPGDAVGLVVADMIPSKERAALEDAGLSWLDARGACHIAWPGVLVHVDRAGSRRSRAQVSDKDGLGPTSIRALQLMFSEPVAEWTISVLAEKARISTGQAHNVFAALERNRLLETYGRGPLRYRKVADVHAALDWLSTIDRARRKPQSTVTYLYGRSTRDVLKRLDAAAHRVGVPYAVTGPAATEMLDIPVLTSTSVAHVRVAVTPLAAVLRQLDLPDLTQEDSGGGHNLELWVDTGEVGTFEAREVSGIRIAPSIRIWLDLARIGGRSEDAARLFREQTLD